MRAMKELTLNPFLSHHKLPEAYRHDAEKWFAPVAAELVEIWKKHGKTLVVGINGSQGSGKSTLADLLALMLSDQYGLNVATLSIDDFYYTRKQREVLAREVHPLMATRGAPGTHDVGLAIKTIQSLCNNETTSIPRFDKFIDDRFPEEQWDQVTTKVNFVLFEGWCLGAEPRSEGENQQAVNELERKEDPDGIWRQYTNQQLRDAYPELFRLVDTWIMLKAPSFDCVYQWRLEQENKLRDSLSGSTDSSDKLMDKAGIRRFIQHTQSVTEHLLETLPVKVDFLFELDKNRKIIKQISGKKHPKNRNA